jgi:RNA polymerase sigma-70 factor (ECF subfamily)
VDLRLEDDPLERLSALVRADRSAQMAVARAEGMTAEEALECVQDALCIFLRRAPHSAGGEEGQEPSPGGSPHDLATLKTMVRNAARNERRRHRRLKPHEAIGDLEGAGQQDIKTAEELLAHAEDVVRLRACVRELCGVERAVVMLRLLEERSGEDVAAALGLSRGHVDVLVHRAKASLRVCMRAPPDTR